jgi:hypothetical protein
MTNYIPKIIHQIWIGPKPPPIKFMNTWKEKHPNFEYILWNEDELKKRNFKMKLSNRFNQMEEINGKADILRWEILYQYGGIFLDADSVCIEPLDELLNLKKCFLSYENEKVKGPGWCKTIQYDDVLARTHPLISTGTMAFTPKHDLPMMAIEWIKNNNVSVIKTKKRAWRTVGPGLLTRLYFSKIWKDIEILPSYYFLPEYSSGLKYESHGKVYAYKEWCSIKKNYYMTNEIDIPDFILSPPKEESISLLIPFYNTKIKYVKECLDSIKNQKGYFNIEIVFINDGSDETNTKLVEHLLNHFMKTVRFVTLQYYKNEKNMGIGFSLNKGVILCNNEIILRMDCDDIMFNDRIKKQFEYMKNNKNVHLCGSQILGFKDNINNIVSRSRHTSLTLEEYKQKKLHWFLNHPTLCYRKQSIIDVGNYNYESNVMIEDFELELKVLAKYKYVHNFNEPLIYYRFHTEQVTSKHGKKNANYWSEIRNKLINDIIFT